MVAVVIKIFKSGMTTRRAQLLTLLAGTFVLPAFATVLPEERGDVLYHRYEGGGVTVDGPSVLVRKNIADTVSVTANYYTDHVSSASIDIVTQASPKGFQEDRVQKSLSLDYLYSSWLYTVGYINSDEPDYIANTYTADASQDFFGDLTNISVGFTYGDDTVKMVRNPGFKESAYRYQYRISISQVITPNLLVALSWENIAADGYLHSPYRSASYFDTATNSRFFGTDAYKNTRDSDAFALRALYYLPYRAAAKVELKHYTDDWGIKANSIDLGYTHPLPKGLMLDVHARYYKQEKAFFYFDMLPDPSIVKYDLGARDKALSTFDSKTLGIGVSYEFGNHGLSFMDKGSINLAWDRMQFNYEDFRDLRVTNVTPGTEPLYSFDADVIRLFLSIWF